MGQATKIDWCDATWNPITGCLHGCDYCYARRIAERFKGKCGYYPLQDKQGNGIHVLESSAWKNNGMKSPYPYGFDPTFHRYKLYEPQHWKRPSTIFVCSMADLFGTWVPDEWILNVFDACRAAPQHRYLFLTKAPERYLSLAELGLLPTEENFWFGCSVPTPSTPFFYSTQVNTFTSIEPLHEDFGPWNIMQGAKMPKWIIVGAETGNRKGKIIPEKAWIDRIAVNAWAHSVPVFMKESLRSIMGGDFRQEFPWVTNQGENA